MPRFKLTIEYDGGPFVGWQRQDNGPSIQGALEDAVRGYCQISTIVHGAGRTDAGVHALGQVDDGADGAERVGEGHQRAASVQIDADPVPALRVSRQQFARPFMIEPGFAGDRAGAAGERHAAGHLELRLAVVVAGLAGFGAFARESVHALAQQRLRLSARAPGARLRRVPSASPSRRSPCFPAPRACWRCPWPSCRANRP
jgi:hypothetical protein